MTDKNFFDETDPGFEENVAPVSFEHSLEIRKSFFSWHKPRKQWIRAKQWASSIAALADALKLKDLQEPLRYLSLPGPDLLDVRSIRPLCEDRDIQLHFVGLNSGDDDNDQAMSRALINQVRSMPGIHPASEVLTDKFEHLGVKKSVAHSKIIEMQRSFDVVNIDLCRSFGEGGAITKADSIPSALFSLLKHQALHRTKDWLLFVTTRADRGPVDMDIMRLFIDWINSKIDGDISFKDYLINEALVLADEFQGESLEVDRLSYSSHVNTFSIGFGNWVLDALINGSPAWRADMLPQIGYHVSKNNAACDMLSLGFYCKRIAPVAQSDNFEIARPIAGSEQNISAIVSACSQKINRRVASRADLDVQLHMNNSEYSEALDASAQLLASARYDEASYREWAEKDRINTSEFLSANGLV